MDANELKQQLMEDYGEIPEEQYLAFMTELKRAEILQ